MKNFIITRSMFCPTCYERNHPRTGDSFVVYGTTGEKFYYRVCHCYVEKRNRGMTPHLISFRQPIDKVGDNIRISVSCGVCEVGFVEGIPPFITFKNVRYTALPLSDFQALLMKWARSGLELI